MFDSILLIPTVVLFVWDLTVPAHSMEAKMLALAMGIWLVTSFIMCEVYDRI